MANRVRKRIQSNFSLQDELITQPPRMMTDDAHPYNSHAQSQKHIRGDTNMANRGRKRKESNFSLQDESITQPPTIVTSDDHCYNTHAQSDKQTHGNKNVAGKSQKYKQTNFNLQSERLVQPRVRTDEERPHTTHAQFHMLSQKDTMMISGTKGGRRANDGCQNKQKAPSVGIDNHQRHGLVNVGCVGQNGAPLKDVINYRSNTRLMEESRIENEHMDGIGSYGQDHEHMDGIGSYGQDHEQGLSQNDIVNCQPNNRLREEPRIHDEHMDGNYEDEHEPEHGSETGGGSTKKESRGPTYMQSVWGRPANLPRYHVEYNEFGQPIGGEKSKFCHFLGSIARNGRYCPLDVLTWRAMPLKNKTLMLDIIKLRFHVPIIAEKWIFRSIGHKWRNWKHFLKTRYWVPNVSVEHLLDERDERVMIDQWVKLLTHWNSKEAKKKSDQNKDARANRNMDQTTGKISFAETREILTKKLGRPPTRIELFHACYISSKGKDNTVALNKYFEMQELSNQLPEGSTDPIDRNDVFAQTMGQDKLGYVRMMGQGISPSDVWGELPCNKSNRVLMEQQSRIAHLESIIAQQRCNTSQGGRGQQISLASASHHDATTLPILGGAYVSLKSLFDPAKTIAKGYIRSTDPKTEVGGQVLGSNWCEVNVKVILEPEECLIRPYDNL